MIRPVPPSLRLIQDLRPKTLLDPKGRVTLQVNTDEDRPVIDFQCQTCDLPLSMTFQRKQLLWSCAQCLQDLTPPEVRLLLKRLILEVCEMFLHTRPTFGVRTALWFLRWSLR